MTRQKHIQKQSQSYIKSYFHLHTLAYGHLSKIQTMIWYKTQMKIFVKVTHVLTTCVKNSWIGLLHYNRINRTNHSENIVNLSQFMWFGFPVIRLAGDNTFANPETVNIVLVTLNNIFCSFGFYWSAQYPFIPHLPICKIIVSVDREVAHSATIHQSIQIKSYISQTGD